MGFIFKSQPLPQDINHPKWGMLAYDRDSESFRCTHFRYPFLLSLGSNQTIQDGLLDYMEKLGARLNDVEKHVELGKSKMLAESQRHSGEISSLRIDDLLLSNYKGKYFLCLIGLIGDDPDGEGRAWRYEYKDFEPIGIGFDS